jgi:hypothetical protein
VAYRPVPPVKWMQYLPVPARGMSCPMSGEACHVGLVASADPEAELLIGEWDLVAATGFGSAYAAIRATMLEHPRDGFEIARFLGADVPAFVANGGEMPEFSECQAQSHQMHLLASALYQLHPEWQVEGISPPDSTLSDFSN